MNKKERALYTRQFGHLYKHVKGSDDCLYCGEPREQYDHCPPLNWVAVYGSNYFYDRKIPLSLIPCCASCNAILGDESLFHFEERGQYIYEWLSINQRKLRMMEPHDPGTLDEYTGRLRDEVKAQVFKQLQAWNRFEYAERNFK